jgi:mannan endo-1,4-beta-mannosidase
MAWQLANEPRPHPRIDREQAFFELIAWAGATADYIHSLDPNHLVSTGNEGVAGCLESRDCFVRLHALPSIDYVTIHLWPSAWGWFKHDKADSTYPQTVDKALSYVQQHTEDAAQLGKPLTLEEFGLNRDEPGYLPSTSTKLRDQYYATLLHAVYASASWGSPMAGSNVWAWTGEGRAGDPKTLLWRIGDDLLGDPTPEHMGGNSVFDTDYSTQAVFKEFAYKMQGLCRSRR